MSLARLDTRVAHLEARRARTTSPSGLVVVWMADGDTRATALQKAGWTLAAVAGRTMLFVQYEEARPDALSPHNTAATSGSAAVLLWLICPMCPRASPGLVRGGAASVARLRVSGRHLTLLGIDRDRYCRRLCLH